MKSIQDLSREAGIDWDRLEDYSAYRVSALELQRFVTLVIAEEHKRVLEGSGEPFEVWTEDEPNSCITGYTADQLSAAVLRERERCVVEVDKVLGKNQITEAIRGVQ